MHYDIALICDLCADIGLPVSTRSERSVKIDLGDGAVLLLENHETEDDCSIGFLGTPWHGHGGLMFVDSRGYYVDLDYLNLLTGLKAGDILVCEREVDGEIVDRYLMHSRYNNEFRNMPPRERLIVRRAKLPD